MSRKKTASQSQRKRGKTKRASTSPGGKARAPSKRSRASRAQHDGGARDDTPGSAAVAQPRAAGDDGARPSPGAPASARRRAPRVAHRGVVAIAETAATHRARAAELCVDLGYEVAPDDRVDTIVARVAAGDVDVLLTALPGGEAIVEAARARSTRPPVIAIVDPPADTAFERADTAGADLFVVRPLARDAMAAALRGAAQLRIVRDRLRAVEGAEAALRERLLRYGESDSVTGFQHIDFFQKLLVIELKRARRYGYPLAVVLVAIDPYPEEPSPAVARQLRTRVATAISACIREIDIPVDFADDRFLVFLPYTPLDGAERVGRRIAKVVASYGKVADGDREHRMSVSVGIAALKPGRPVSFARLIRDAKAAVRAAQLKGGGQVVVRR